MPISIPELDEFSGALADDDEVVVIDTSVASGRKDRRMTVAALRLQLARATVVTNADPTANDDEGDGYVVGNTWLNTSDGGFFVLTDATAGAAVWSEK